MNEALLIPDVLAALRMSRRTFERLRRSGRLPLAELLPRLGRRPRYSRASVDAYLAGRTRRVA